MKLNKEKKRREKGELRKEKKRKNEEIIKLILEKKIEFKKEFLKILRLLRKIKGEKDIGRIVEEVE